MGRCGDHPRVCGEKFTVLVCDFANWGITPACAGKSAAPRGQCKRQRDHPRVCGEKYEPETGPWRCLGSPPRVRGKEHCPESKFRPGRITPACAGKSRYAAEVCTHVWDHPRVCGEKAVAIIWWYSCTGSPPRVRGKVHFRNLKEMPFGITPACAGKSGLEGYQAC